MPAGFKLNLLWSYGCVGALRTWMVVAVMLPSEFAVPVIMTFVPDWIAEIDTGCGSTICVELEKKIFSELPFAN